MSKHHQTLFDDQTFYRLDNLVRCCLTVFDKILRPSNIRSKTLFDGQCFVRLDSRVSNMFDAGMRTTFAQRLVSIGHFRVLGIGLELACNGGSCGGISLRRD